MYETCHDSKQCGTCTNVCLFDDRQCMGFYFGLFETRHMPTASQRLAVDIYLIPVVVFPKKPVFVCIFLCLSTPALVQ